MTSLLLLLLVTAMFVQVLLLPTVVGATGFGQDMADDVIIFKGMSCNDIKNKNEDRRTQICKRKKVVRFSCPQTCDDVSVFKKECPSKITSRKFERDCSKKYQHNRQCDYDYKYTGCTWDDLRCTSLQGKTCDYESSSWLWEVTSIQQCIDPPKDLPVHDDCTPCSDVPTEGCPKQEPTFLADCSDFENGLTCEYNLMLTGCNPSEIQCLPSSSFTCSAEGKQWEGVSFIPAPCPSDKCPEDWPVPQQCSWPKVLNMQYEEAERIIRDSDTVGYLTTIEKVVNGTFVTEDYSLRRVRVFVNNFVENIIVEIPMVG
mmetsp:Transcript_49992/g.55756  ORF Transcript_49992/g.55756 Transcript_49992/m.55756 type:complete len:315 (-) Transcript_49992:93-1037(-)